MREGQPLTVDVDPKFVQVLSSTDYKDYSVIGPRIPFEIGKVTEGSNAEKAGLLKDDEYRVY